MENIIDAYNSNSDNESPTIQKKEAVKFEQSQISRPPVSHLENSSKQERKRAIERSIITSTDNRNSSGIPQKKVRGYISKREKLKESEGLETKTKEKNPTAMVNQEIYRTSSYDSTLLNIPSRISSALENTNSKNESRFNTIPKRQIITLAAKHVIGVNSILWCG